VHHGNLSYFQVDYSLVVALLLVERQVNFIIQRFFIYFWMMAQLKWLIATQKKKKKEKIIELGRHPI
jgi:hypothetical protein